MKLNTNVIAEKPITINHGIKVRPRLVHLKAFWPNSIKIICKITIHYINEDCLELIFDEPYKAVTPGQACVLYDGEECLGSGIIDTIYKNNERLWYL